MLIFRKSSDRIVIIVGG